ncbi:hypothetical protein SEA_FUZZBUSTER_46 [Microbacterium phage FuzzBuster]|uniref:Uncharacterized protein n=1 Tax=Microbacterium phage FuzzBuster TaxID=2590935 RepID=A0A516KV13_9CAUD|nr:hypothetical protein SEA_FUZZBUSTER_46 [Microbacterium phage FuzzBuster]
MMSEQDDDKIELEESRRALHTAKIDAVKTDATVASIHRSTAEILSAVESNGYIDRFRRVLRGAH